MLLPSTCLGVCKFRAEREPLKPFEVSYEITVRSSKFIKPPISVCSE